MRVLAAILTFNRCDLVQRCISGVLSQVTSPDEILVVDNGSSDGTAEMLKRFPVTVIFQENAGSAGGWNTAINYALQKQFDAIWLMDDDGFPHVSALQVLMTNFSNRYSCLSSIVVKEHEPEKFVFPFPILNSNGWPRLFSLKRKVSSVVELRDQSLGNIYPFAHLFNGALISMSAVEAIGNVNKNLFLFGDEVDYFCRLRTYGEVCSQLEAIHYHPDVASRPYSLDKAYYYLRNSFYVHNKYFDHSGLRNLLSICALIFRVASRNGFRAAFSMFVGEGRRKMFRGIAEGRRGVFEE